MSVQSSNNFNIQNKFIKIDGEYVKLYVTTNKTLPKLLKNTGSLIVYHDGLLNDKNDNTPINHLYLANNLIASGWGFHKESQRDDAEYFFNYGNDLQNNHIGKDDAQYNHNYYDIIEKLYDRLSFWDELNAGTDVIQKHSLYLEGETPGAVSFRSLYEDSSVFHTINDIADRICSTNKSNDKRFVPYNALLTNTEMFAPYISQYFNYDIFYIKEGNNAIQFENSQVIDFKNSCNVDSYNSLYRNIYLDMLPYMLGPAIYEKPEIIDIDAEIFYGYDSSTINYSYNDGDNLISKYKAKKVNGKYQIPKGANILSVALNVTVKMNDARSLKDMSFKFAKTQYNNHITNGNTSDETSSLNSFKNNQSTIIYADIRNNSNYNETNCKQIAENFHSFSTVYDTKKIALSKIDTIYDDNFVKFSGEFSYESNLSVLFEDVTLIQDIKFTVEGISKLKRYAAFSNEFFMSPVSGRTALRCMTDRTHKLAKFDNSGKLIEDLMYSFEYAWTETEIDTKMKIEVEATDILFVNTIPVNGKFKDNNTYAISENATNNNLSFTTDDVFASYKYISSIVNNYSIKILEKPLKREVSNSKVDEYKQGFDIVTFGIPCSKMIKNVWANIELYNTNYRKVQKENITGLLKYINKRNYFISLNPEMAKNSSNNSVVYRFACITDVQTNIFAQPYKIYFCILPRTYITDTQNNGIISFEIELDEQPNYISSEWSNEQYVSQYSVNVAMYTKNRYIDVVGDNISIYRKIDIKNDINSNNIEALTNTNYDSTHIFNLSYVYSQQSLNPFAMISNDEDYIESIKNMYLEKLNNISL